MKKVVVFKNTMRICRNNILNNSRNLVYLNANDFTRKLRSLKMYCPQSYKNFIFKVSKESFFETENGRYSKNIFTSDEFKFVYGQIKLVYSIENDKVIIEDLEPSQFLLDGYMTSLNIYKKMFYRNKNDKFKIDLMFSLKENSERK